MGLCGWSEADQILLRLYDVPALLLRLRPALPHVADLRSSASPGSTWRASDEEVPQLDGPQGDGNGLVPGGGVMREGWLMNPEDRWTYRFHRNDKAWFREPKVFVDMGRPMPDGSPALHKTRQHLRREQAEGMWKDLVRKGWKQVPAAWGPEAEP